MSEVILIAATGLAREVLAMVRSSGQYDVLGVLDEAKEMAGATIEGAGGPRYNRRRTELHARVFPGLLRAGEVAGGCGGTA